MGFFKRLNLKTKISVSLAFAGVHSLVFPSKALAIEVSIPEIQSRVADEFVLESIAKLDDFIEEIRAKEKLRGIEPVGFGTATIVQLGTITGIMVDQFIFRKTLVSGMVDEVKKIATAGKAGRLPFDLSNFTRRWFVGASAANIAAAKNEEMFVVHVQDLALFREIMTSVRQRQQNILYRIWQDAAAKENKYRDKILNMENLIRENRPSFKKIYEACAGNPSSYKNSTMLEIYSQGLKDYFTALLLTPAAVTKQIDAGFISPTLNSYINQEVLPMALRKCFNVSLDRAAKSATEFEKTILSIPYVGAGVTMATDIVEDEHHRFIAQLFAVDTASRFVVFASIFSIYKFKDLFRRAKLPGFKPVGKFQNTWLGDTMKYLQALFKKISPSLIAKVVVTSQVTISGYTLYSLKKEYDKTTEVGQARRTTEEFNRIAKKYFHDRAIEQIQELKNLLFMEGVEAKDRAAVEEEIRKWKMIEDEFVS